MRKRWTPEELTPVKRPSLVEIEPELEQLSRWMDTIFRIPGINWRFGLNAIIDLIPGIGDTSTTVIALVLLIGAVRYRISKLTMLRMGLNIAIYFLVGLIPFVGDAFDAWWKPNARNLQLLRRYATTSPLDTAQARKSDWIFVGGIIVILLAMLSGSIAITYLILHKLITGLNGAVLGPGS